VLLSTEYVFDSQNMPATLQ